MARHSEVTPRLQEETCGAQPAARKSVSPTTASHPPAVLARGQRRLTVPSEVCTVSQARTHERHNMWSQQRPPESRSLSMPGQLSRHMRHAKGFGTSSASVSGTRAPPPRRQRSVVSCGSARRAAATNCTARAGCTASRRKNSEKRIESSCTVVVASKMPPSGSPGLGALANRGPEVRAGLTACSRPAEASTLAPLCVPTVMTLRRSNGLTAPAPLSSATKAKRTSASTSAENRSST